MEPTTKRICQGKAAYERRVKKKEFDKQLLAELKKAALEQKGLKEVNKQLRADLAAKIEENVNLNKALKAKDLENAAYKNTLWMIQTAILPPNGQNYGVSIEDTNLNFDNI